eukprot:SAG31_NODE_497_length_14862_cov_6.951568_6_plen_47_part_00
MVAMFLVSWSEANRLHDPMQAHESLVGVVRCVKLQVALCDRSTVGT